MKHTVALALLFISMFVHVCFAQDGGVVEDFKPSEVNQPGKLYPQVNSEGRVRTQILAPDAKSVQLDIGGVKYDMRKDDKGLWTGDSAPQDEGFHYYQFNMDGASVRKAPSTFTVPDDGSGIEIGTRSNFMP